MCFAHFHNGKSRQLSAIHGENLKQIQDRAWRDGYDCVHPRRAIFVVLYTCHILSSSPNRYTKSYNSSIPTVGRLHIIMHIRQTYRQTDMLTYMTWHVMTWHVMTRHDTTRHDMTCIHPCRQVDIHTMYELYMNMFFQLGTCSSLAVKWILVACCGIVLSLPALWSVRVPNLHIGYMSMTQRLHHLTGALVQVTRVCEGQNH